MGSNNQTNHSGASHGSVKEYVTGFILSIILTVVPFTVVMQDLASIGVSIILILVCAIAQLLVQAVFFLHMNTSSEQSWNVMTAIYALVIIVVLIGGSSWIFAHLHANILMGH